MLLIYICVCVCYLYKYIYIYMLEIYISNIIQIEFGTEHLVLDNQLLCLPLGKTVSPALSLPWLLAVLWVGLKPRGLSFVYLAFLLLLFSSCLGYSNCFIGKHLNIIFNEVLLVM